MYNTTRLVTIGHPAEELPTPAGHRAYTPAPHWEAVAKACRQAPNRWVPVTIQGFTKDSYRGARYGIQHGQLASFRDGTWDAAVRDDTLYVRLTQEPAVKAVAS